MCVEPARYVFGPVPSRRLGRSLGVDLVPFKTCTHDCIYCQLGRTTNKTLSRAEYVPLDVLVPEVGRTLQEGAAPEYITLSGSGEPTLYSRLAELIAQIKTLTDIPVAVLTNGSLLWQPEVRAALAEADLVLPSLDAGSEAVFQKVNRPHPGISFAKMVAGLQEFRREFAKPIWLEVFLLRGLSAWPEEVERIAEIAATIAPDRVQLNTVARPPAEDYAQGLAASTLRSCARRFGARAEIIADYNAETLTSSHRASEAEVKALLQRRPCRVEDIARGLGLHRNEVLKHLGHLLRTGEVSSVTRAGQTYYSAQGSEEALSAEKRG